MGELTDHIEQLETEHRLLTQIMEKMIFATADPEEYPDREAYVVRLSECIEKAGGEALEQEEVDFLYTWLEGILEEDTEDED